LVACVTLFNSGRTTHNTPSFPTRRSSDLLHNEPNASILLTTDETIDAFNNGGGSIINDGTLSKTGGSGNADISATALTNSGLVDDQNGTRRNTSHSTITCPNGTLQQDHSN